MKLINMQHHGDTLGAAGVGTVAGLIVHYAALLPSVPPALTQALVTLLVGVATVAANHFVKRWLDRRWPDRKRRRGDSIE